MKILELKNVSFSYTQKVPLFSGVTTTVQSGDFIGVFWENGKWKTTLIKLILGIQKWWSGEISWFDQEGEKCDKNIYNIEYISQKASMLDATIPITVREIVMMGNKEKSSGIFHLNKTCSYSTLETALKHVGMEKYLHTPFHELSGGQKQRVLIAKSLLSNPDLIIMDEATSGLDIIGQKHFYDLLGHLNREHHITIILISHDTKFIEEKIKKLWYIWGVDCEECHNKKIHLFNIKKMFPKQEIEFFN